MLNIIPPPARGQASYLSLDRTARLARENAIARHIESMIDVELERLSTLPDARTCTRYEEEFRRFADFAMALDVGRLPARGHTVALYLLDRLDNGARPDELATAAAAIAHAHTMAERYFDWAPVRATLDFATRDADDAHPDNTP